MLPTSKQHYNYIFLIYIDMGWPTKGTGNNYNSHTGFGSFMGAYTKESYNVHDLLL